MRIFLQHDAGETIVARPPVPELIDEIFPTVVVVEQRGIEAARIHGDRIGPFAVDRRRRNEIVVKVAQGRAAGAADRGAAVALHIGVDQPELAVGMTETRRPHAAGIRITAHVELAGPPKRPRQQAPVLEVARMMDLHAGKPFEGRCRDVIVVADPDDRRIGIEALEDGISDHLSPRPVCARRTRAPRRPGCRARRGRRRTANSRWWPPARRPGC